MKHTGAGLSLVLSEGLWAGSRKPCRSHHHAKHQWGLRLHHSSKEHRLNKVEKHLKFEHASCFVTYMHRCKYTQPIWYGQAMICMCRILSKTEDYELRLYDVYPYISTPYERRDEGFLALGAYMDGHNSESVRMNSTQPVVMRYEPSTVHITSVLYLPLHSCWALSQAMTTFLTYASIPALWAPSNMTCGACY